MTTRLAPLVSAGRAGTAGQQCGLAGGVEEGDGAAGNAVVGAEHQRRAVAAIDMARLAAARLPPAKAKPAGRVTVVRHIEGAEAAGVLDGGGEANEVARHRYW
jgi:hypothetical protein